VRSSAAHHSSRSLLETSALLPRDTNAERPRPSSAAVSRIASPRAPDCDAKATEPSGGGRLAKDALSETAGSVWIRPMQFGPTIRIPLPRRTSRIFASSAAPSAFTSLKPAVMVTIARTPLRAASSTAGRTRSRGTVSTARSTGPGTASRDGQAGTEWTEVAWGLTG
jgi:hypothetical protein